MPTPDCSRTGLNILQVESLLLDLQCSGRVPYVGLGLALQSTQSISPFMMTSAHSSESILLGLTNTFDLTGLCSDDKSDGNCDRKLVPLVWFVRMLE